MVELELPSSVAPSSMTSRRPTHTPKPGTQMMKSIPTEAHRNPSSYVPFDDDDDLDGLYPSIHLPISLCDDDTLAAVNAMALLDTGSSVTLISRAVADRLGTAHGQRRGHLYGFASAHAPIPRQRTTRPISFFYGRTYDVMYVDVVDMQDEHIILGRDFIKRFNIHIGPLHVCYPQELQLSADDDEYIDVHEKQSRVTDVDGSLLSPTEKIARDDLREIVNGWLADHVAQVPITSTIKHPDAFVRIQHEPGQPLSKNKYRPQYQGRVHLHEYITAQVNTWCINEKAAKWDTEILGPDIGEFNSPLLPVATTLPSGAIAKVRVCNDYQSLNIGLIDDKTPLPNITHMFGRMANAKYFTEFDMVAAFNQFPVNPDDQHKLAFTWQQQRYYFKCAPFGLKHVSSHCQRVLQAIFVDMPWVNPYVDNLLIASNTLEEHLEHIRLFIIRCTEHCILLDPKKSKIALTNIRTLCNVLSGTGIRPDPVKQESIRSWPTPTTREQLVSFLCTANYLRNYIRHYADIAAPLDALRNVKTFIWTQREQKSFDLLKQAILNAPALKFADYDKPFALAIDSSINGIGAVLYQPEKPGDMPSAENIVSFASRSLRKYERRYSVYKLELNALIFGLRTFENALYATHFQVFTDHQALVYLQTQKDVNRTLRNWYSIIAEFDFDITHLSGHLNVLPDALSRIYPSI